MFISNYFKKTNKVGRKRVILIILGMIFLLVGLGVLTAEGGAWAKDGIDLQIGIPTGKGVVNKVSGFPEYIKLIYNLFIGIVGILAVIMVMLGGFQWLLAAGNSQKIEGAKTTIISAIMGLVLALSSWQILELVNPDLKYLSLKDPASITFSTTKLSVGLCKNDSNNMPLLGPKEKSPECGKTYILTKQNNGSDEECWGYTLKYFADSSKICLVKSEKVLSTVKVASIGIVDERSNGFGNQNWEVTNNASYEGDINCGKLYASIRDNNYYVGNSCPSGEYCVIDQSKHKFKFTKTKADLSWFNRFFNSLNEVGEYMGHGCVKW